MTKTALLSELAGIEPGECGQRLIVNPCTYGKQQHNWREMKAALEKLCNTPIPQPTDVTPSVSSAIKTGTVTGSWTTGTAAYWQVPVEADDGSGTFNLRLPMVPAMDPNLQSGDEVAYMETSAGDPYICSDYLDDKIGSVKMWSSSLGTIPQGWALMDGSNNSTGSGINLMGQMVELCSTAGDSAGAQNVEEQLSGIELSGVILNTEEGYANVQIGTVAPSISLETTNVSVDCHEQQAVCAALACGDIANTSLSVCPCETGILCTETGGGGTTSNDTVYVTTTSDGNHQHDFPEVTQFAKLGADVDVLQPQITSTCGSHTHDGEMGSHSHSIDPHYHCISDPGHCHDIDDHCHDFEPTSHCHLIPELAHTINDPGHLHTQLPHTHTASDSGHAHPVDAELFSSENAHTHLSGKPRRFTIIPIERIS